MFKLPTNIQYRVFDKDFKGSTAKYLTKEDKATVEEVQQNRDAICAALDASEIAILYQVHSADVYYAEKGTEIDSEPKMDALYTDKKGVILAIQTADCVPVLIAGKDGKVIGAAHCGWKSAFHGILENLVNQMQNNGSKDFIAIIGPSIHQESYEVTKEYRDIFLNQSSENEKFFIPSIKDEHFMFDLVSYVRCRLAKLGINEIDHISENTYINVDKYPSYRRHCHTGEIYNSSILSTIVML